MEILLLPMIQLEILILKPFIKKLIILIKKCMERNNQSYSLQINCTTLIHLSMKEGDFCGRKTRKIIFGDG